MAISHFGSMTALSGSNPASGTWTLPTAPGGGWTDQYVGIFWLYARNSTYNITEPTGVGITTKMNHAAGTGFGRLYIGYRYLVSGDTTFGFSRSVTNTGCDTIWGVDVVDLGATGGSGDPFEAESGATSTTFSNTADPDPVAVTPASNDNYIWTIFGKNNDHGVVTNPPTNYTNGSDKSSTAGTDGGAGTAYRVLSGGSGASENPGVWDLSAGTASDDGVTWTAAIAPIIVNTTVTPTTASLATATFAPTVTASAGGSVSVTPGTASLATAKFAPVIHHKIITAAPTALALTTFAPTIGHKIITAAPTAISLVTFAPSVALSNNTSVTPGTATAALTGFAPTATATNNISVTPGAASLTLTGFAPTTQVWIQPPQWTPNVAFSSEAVAGGQSFWTGIVRAMPIWYYAGTGWSYADDGTRTDYENIGSGGEAGGELYASYSSEIVDLGSYDPPTTGSIFIRFKALSLPAVARFFGFADGFEARSDASGFLYNDIFKTGGTSASSSSISTGTYYNILFTWGSGTNEIYLNGTQVLSQTPASDDPGTGTLSLGARTGTTDYIDGRVSAFYVWDRVLDSTERAAIAIDPWILFRQGSISVTPAIGTLTLTGFAPTVTAIAPVSVTPGIATLITASFAPTLNLTIVPSTASLATSLSEPTVSFTAHITVTPTTSALITSLFAPAVVAGQFVSPIAASLILTGFAPVLGLKVIPATATLTTTRFAPVLDLKVTPTTKALTTAFFAPTVTQTQHALLTPEPGSLILATYAPNVVGLAYGPFAQDCVDYWIEYDAAATQTEKNLIQRRFLLAHGGRLVKIHGEVVLVGGMYCPRF